MEFEILLEKAQQGDKKAMEVIFQMYKPLLSKRAILNGRFNEDLYQELSNTLINCIKRFGRGRFLLPGNGPEGMEL